MTGSTKSSLAGFGSYETWRLASNTLVARFHGRAAYGIEQQRVEAAIIELASEHLHAELGDRAAWEAFDARAWRDTTLVLDDGYRRRVQTTLSGFFDFLADTAHLSAIANKRIQSEITGCLGDGAESEQPRHSYTRDLASPAGEAIAEDVRKVLRFAR